MKVVLNGSKKGQYEHVYSKNISTWSRKEHVARGAKNEIYFHDTIKEIQKKRVASRPNWRTDDDEFDPYEVRNDPAPHDCKDQAQRDAENAETTHPADFFSNQLRPNDGAICYAAVFGDYSLDD
ncbi:unnamed protein product [Nesidiocoris tenuis]|uniref:Uncharacterized protein n=1 Tax=Nesidiocoris tenuis TaxID=355587 RepID=A0A6H5H8E7_9HEMI|nr:unnamed protein product [Nesidiocoris tenuis]